ncbi:TetR/AcrR family transcriptional regulator [Thalassospira sp.]|uniref:TetR/AcrR family transcriptional regulator n=1 Tax=Thalassospira sp. TaxID=1912094 RepID=UPI003AA9B11E
MARPKQFNRTNVLDKAIPVFWMYGLAGASLSQLEQATGLNRSSLYAEFSSKEELFKEALKRYVSSGPAREILLAEPLGLSNVERFLNVAQWFSEDARGCFFVNSVRDLAELPGSVVSLIAEQVKAYQSLIELNLQNVSTFVSPKTLSEIVWSYFAGLMLKDNFANTDPQTRSDEIRAFVDLLAGRERNQ